uniref:DUF4283 domain-containing protein n=1 Tax=Populus alba TaxID=43335 RepID=A0A4U5NQU6_POPAL|nr:hypothetical protein D5086_0000250260 [Populus alba]
MVSPDSTPDDAHCAPCIEPPTLPSSQPRDVCPSDSPAPVMGVASGSASLDGVLVEDCYVGSDEEILEEDQLDLNFSDEECGGSPISPAQPPAEKMLTPLLQRAEDSPQPSPLLRKCLPLLLLATVCLAPPLLQNFALNHLSKTCAISTDDIKPEFEVWNLCAVGYISGKNPGFRALHNIISNVWKCDATLTIHDSGWLIYKFKTEDDKLAILRGGPYLVYGRPLILRPMKIFFDFSSEEMTRVLCDQLTSTLSRMSYARVLVEIDLLEDLRHSVEISLPEGPILHQKVVYETLPNFCNFCCVLGHTRLLCPKASAANNKVPASQPHDMQPAKGNVFGRLGPQLHHEGSPSSQIQDSPPHGQVPVAPEVATESEVNAIAPEEWVTVVPKRKASKQPGNISKGKEVIIAEPGPVAPLGETPSSLACAGEERHSPTPTAELLVANPCPEEVQSTPTPKPGSLADQSEDTVPVSNPGIGPPLGAPFKGGVRTRSQKHRYSSGRVPPSPANI